MRGCIELLGLPPLLLELDDHADAAFTSGVKARHIRYAFLRAVGTSYRFEALDKIWGEVRDDGTWR